MSTFIGQLVGFALIVFIAVKWVVPPVRTMMHNQQEAVRAALAESKSAADKLATADERHKETLEVAKAQAAKVTDEARSDSERIAEQLREQAIIEAERIKAQGEQHIQLLRQQTIRGCASISVPNRWTRPRRSSATTSPILPRSRRPSTGFSTISTRWRRPRQCWRRERR